MYFFPPGSSHDSHPQRISISFRGLPAGAIALALFTLVFLSQGLVAAQPIATWSGGEVSTEEYDRWLSYRKLEDSAETRQAELERMLSVEVLANAARQREVQNSKRYQLLDREFQDAVLARIVRRDIAAAIEVTEAEIDALVERYPEAFQKPERRLIRHIFKFKSEGATGLETDRIRQEMEGLRERVLAGEDFRRLARAESESQTRFRNGAIGLVTPGDLPEPIEEIAWSLGEGEVSQVLEASNGFTLLFCDRIPPPKLHDDEEVREMFRSNLRKQKADRAWTELMAALRGRTPAELDPSVVHRPDGVIARYPLGELTTADLEVFGTSTARSTVDLQALGKAALERRIDALIEQRLLAEHARNLGLNKSAEFEEAVYWRRREALAIDEIGHRIRLKMVPPSDDELRAYFAANEYTFRKRAKFEISVISLRYTRGDDQARRATDREAKELLAQLRSDPDLFAEIARTRSEHQTAPAGGYVGWLPKPELAAFSLRLGRALAELAQPGITTEIDDDGIYWIGRLHDSRPERPSQFNEVRWQIEQVVGTTRARQLQDEVSETVRISLALKFVPYSPDHL